MNKDIIFPSEWHKQSAIQLTWPHENSDWDYMLKEVTNCFVHIAKTILPYQKLIVVCKDSEEVKKQLGNGFSDHQNLKLAEIASNDTWARDHSGISVFIGGRPVIYDFTFNGWGLKFAANFDNQITKAMFDHHIFKENVECVNQMNFVLEGGALESDGMGTLLTTSECLLSPNRNSFLNKAEIEIFLKDNFGLKRVLWLDHGYLKGDDTDSHIDTLARFCDEHTIAYVKCDDTSDEHFSELNKMEKQLHSFTDTEGNPYKLIPLPMAQPVIENGERLPATYANFLIMNEAVLVPTYGSNHDEIALQQICKAFPERKIIGIDCRALIKQHGSLHCVTMQYPENFVH